MHQKCRIRNFEDISKCLLRNSKLSSPYIYPQLLDQIDEDNPNENTSKAGTIIFLVKTCDILSFSLAALKSNLKEPNLKKETSDIISLISRSSRLYSFCLKKFVWWFYLPLFRPTRELILFKCLINTLINHIYFKMPRAWSLLMLFFASEVFHYFFLPVLDLIWQIWNFQRRSLWLKETKKQQCRQKNVLLKCEKKRNIIQSWRSQYE